MHDSLVQNSPQKNPHTEMYVASVKEKKATALKCTLPSFAFCRPHATLGCRYLCKRVSSFCLLQQIMTMHVTFRPHMHSELKKPF